MAQKIRWAAEEVVTVDKRKLRCYARPSRSEIIVRVENDGDTTKYAEWGMPKLMGIGPAILQAAFQTKPEDIRA